MTASSPLTLTFLGSGNAFAPGRYWSGFLANGRYLFDAPPTLLAHLKKLSLDLTAIEAVFLSHFHGDHFAGLPFLLLEYDELTPRQEPLTVVGPPGVQERIESLYAALFPGSAEKRTWPGIRYVEVVDGAELTAGSAGVHAFRVEHSPRLECFGYRMVIDGRTLAYTGDAAYCDAVFALAEGAEVLVVDCAFASGRRRPLHMSFEDVAEVRARVDPRTAIILTHVEAAMPAHQLPNTFLAQDFATFTF